MFHFLSFYTLLYVLVTIYLSSHDDAMLLLSYQIKGPKMLYSLYETVVYKGPKTLLSLCKTMTIYKGPKALLSLYETMTIYKGPKAL